MAKEKKRAMSAAERVENSGRFLSEVVSRCDDEMGTAARQKYMKSALHTAFVLSDGVCAMCEEETERLRCGQASPRLEICCCIDTFVALFASQPEIRYDSCELPCEEEVEEGVGDEPEDPLLSCGEFAALRKLSGEALLKRLLKDYPCRSCVYSQVHKEDRLRQQAYQSAVTEYLTAAACLAKGIGSESARRWLEALRLLQPVDIGEDGVQPPAREELERAYRTAEEAQARLWVDLRYQALAGVTPHAARKGAR